MLLAFAAPSGVSIAGAATSGVAVLGTVIGVFATVKRRGMRDGQVEARLLWAEHDIIDLKETVKKQQDVNTQTATALSVIQTGVGDIKDVLKDLREDCRARRGMGECPPTKNVRRKPDDGPDKG